MAREIIGKCPKCKENIFESEKSFYCIGFRNDPKCDFSIWKEFFGANITKEIMQELLENGETTNEIEFKSREGNKYFAKLKLDLNQKYFLRKVYSTPKQN